MLCIVAQAKYEAVCAESSVRIVTPDWISHCVETMCRIDEGRYHPRLLVTTSHPASPQPDVRHPSHSDDPSVAVMSLCDTAVEKSDSQQFGRPHLKSIGNASELSTEVCQSLVKPLSSTKVCIIALCFVLYIVSHGRLCSQPSPCIL